MSASGGGSEPGGTRWLDEAEMAAWYGLRQMERQLSAVLGRELFGDSRLSLQDYSVLVALSEQPEGRMRAFELARAVGWEKSRLSHHVSRMAARRLVERQQCPSDQRGSFVALTGHGRGAIEAAAPGHLASVRRYFVDVLSPGQLEQLAGITKAVLASLPCGLPEGGGPEGASRPARPGPGPAPEG